MTDRAVSEAIGFVMVFALITSTIGIVFATGVGSLQDAQRAEHMENVERAFEVLGNNMGELHTDGVPSRATEIKLTGGTMSIEDPVTVTFRINDTSDPNHNATYTMNGQPVVFSSHSQRTSVAYEAGAVIRSDGPYSRMLSDPPWLHDGSKAVIPMVVTLARDDRTSVGGDITVLVIGFKKTREVRGEFLTPSNPGGADANLSVRVQSPRADAWARYFERENFTALDGDASDDDVRYYFHTDRVYVTRTEIEVSIRL